MSIREAARGRRCYLRLPGVCNGNPDTTVLAHIRANGTAGGGLKPPDTCALPACSACHDVFDRRVPSNFDREFLLAEASRGQRQWLKDLDLEGYRLVKVEPKRRPQVSKILPRRVA